MMLRIMSCSAYRPHGCSGSNAGSWRRWVNLQQQMLLNPTLKDMHY
jgi:hypothetical protein